MAERRRNRKKKEQTEVSEDDGKPSKDEYAVAKYIREKLPEKKTMLLGHKVDYFIAARAIDCLMDSPWATTKGKREAIFTTRESVVEFMDKMLQHKFFHRAKKIVVQKDSKKKKKDDDAESSKEKEKDQKDKKKDTKSKEEVEEKLEPKKDGDKEEKKKEKRKIKLDMHLDQIYVDGNEAYVWIYDPTPARSWIIGLLFVAGATLVCLFPLWPQSIRHYIYYLSVAAAFFLVFIIGLAIFRVIIFIIIWAVTFGHHHFWLFPNLTEDVGFFESFWPIYMYEYKGAKTKESKKKDKKEESEKDDKEESKKDDKEEESKEEKSEDKDNSSNETKDNEEKSPEKSDSSSDQEKNDDDDEEDQVNSESEHHSDIEKVENGDNDFEILDPEEAPHSK